MGFIGDFAQAYGSYQEGKATAKAYRYNEAVMQREGEMISKSSQMKKNQISRAAGKMKGRQKALYAKSGVVTTSGSPFEVMVDTAGQYEMDKATETYNAEIEKRRAGSKQAQYGTAAKNAYSGGLLKMGTHVMTGLGKMYQSGGGK